MGVLSCSRGYAVNKAYHPSTGGQVRADTAVVAIPIETIRQANIKLIERKYLLEVVKQQDSISAMKDNYIKEQRNIIVDFQKRVDEANKLNVKLNNSINKQKKVIRVLGTGLGAVVIGAIIGILIR